jgi:hypothetical protein
MSHLTPALLAPLTASALVLAACGAASPATTTTAPGTAPALTGAWTSPCTPMNDQQAFSLAFVIEPATWAVDYTVFADTSCTTKFMTVHIDGPYEIGATSTVVPDAHDARFGFTTKSVIPHLEAAAQFLASPAGCGLAGFAVGQAMDISTTGCANLGQRPIAACAADFDLVKLEGDQLTFGERPADNDMCSEDKRPRALSQLSITRS